jgi:ATP-dependent DNA helicase PIF1
MQMYNSNITGSKAYFHKRRIELESLMESCGMPTMWFTLSCADNHWEDLHRILVGLNNYPEACTTQKKKAEHRRKLVRDNPHIVDAFFYRRVQALLDTLFGPLGLEAEWTWFRIEYQGRGAAHAHGCLRLKDAPGLSNLASKVIVGRAAQRLGNFQDGIRFTDEEIK